MSTQKDTQQIDKPNDSQTQDRNRAATPDQVPDHEPPVDWQGLTEATDPNNPVVESERTGGSKHSPEPDARDDAKVERLAAPDWRGEQPLPSARNAIDPRGENSPAELFEPPEEKRTE